jgi:hypothetical protein
MLRPPPRRRRPSPRHSRPPAVHRRRVLPHAEEDGVIEHSPAVHIRRPRIDYESHVAHLDRNELGAILVTAGLGSARDHALVSGARLLLLTSSRQFRLAAKRMLPASRPCPPGPAGMSTLQSTTSTLLSIDA